MADNPEVTHQLRVNLRTLRSWISYFRPLVEDDVYKEVQGLLRDNMQSLTGLRELDVLRADLNQFHLEHKKYSVDGDSFIRWVDQERVREQMQVGEWMEGNVMQERLTKVRELLMHPFFTEQVDDSLKQFSKKRFSKWCDRGKAMLRKMKPDNKESVHEVRIHHKKIRYAAELMEAQYGAHEWNQVKVTKTLKTLGNLCDTYRFLEILEEFTKREGAVAYQSEMKAYEDHLRARQKKICKKLKHSNKISK